MTSPLSRYLAEIVRHPILSREEECHIAAEYQRTGDAKLRDQLVRSNLRFAVKVAKKYRLHRTIPLLDLIQQANLGLLRAVESFVPEKGFRLTTYSHAWMQHFIRRYLLYTGRAWAIPAHLENVFFHAQKVRSKMELGGDEPSVDDVARMLGIPRRHVENVETAMQGTASLDKPVASRDGEGSVLRDFLEARDEVRPDVQTERTAYLESIRAKVMVFSRKLSSRDRDILRRRLLTDDPETLGAIGEDHGISRERVRQVEHQLKRRLRVHLREFAAELEDDDRVSAAG